MIDQINTDCFSYDTAKDQESYFFGEIQTINTSIPDILFSSAQETYRVIDGKLNLIISGLGKQEVSKRIIEASKSK